MASLKVHYLLSVFQCLPSHTVSHLLPIKKYTLFSDSLIFFLVLEAPKEKVFLHHYLSYNLSSLDDLDKKYCEIIRLSKEIADGVSHFHESNIGLGELVMSFIITASLLLLLSSFYS